MGQDVSILIVVNGVLQSTLTAISSFNIELELEVLSKGYLGEKTERKDTVYKGIKFDGELNPFTEDVFTFAQAVLNKAKRLTPDVLFNITTPKFAAQALRKSAEIGWKPTQYLVSVSQSASAVLKPAGFENAVGVISSTYLLSPSDPAAAGNKDVAEYLATMKQYFPGGDPEDTLNSIGYSVAATMAQVLRQAGDNLTRENIMKQAASLQFTPPMLYPGIDVKTSADDFFPIEKKVLQRFNGKAYEVISSTGS